MQQPPTPGTLLAQPGMLLRDALKIYGRNFALFTSLCLVPQLIGALPQVLFFYNFPDAGALSTMALPSPGVAPENAAGFEGMLTYFIPIFFLALVADGVCIVSLSNAYFFCALSKQVPKVWPLALLGLSGPWFRTTIARLLISITFIVATVLPIAVLRVLLGGVVIGLLPFSSLLGVFLSSSLAVLPPMLCLKRCSFRQALQCSMVWIKQARFAGFVVLGYSFLTTILISAVSYTVLGQAGVGPLSPLIASIIHSIALPLSYGPHVLLYQALLRTNAPSKQEAAEQEQKILRMVSS